MNTDAERLLDGLPFCDQDPEEIQRREILIALAAERRATVERIRERIEELGVPYHLNGIAAILDAEAER